MGLGFRSLAIATALNRKRTGRVLKVTFPWTSLGICRDRTILGPLLWRETSQHSGLLGVQGCTRGFNKVLESPQRLGPRDEILG